MWCTTFAAAIGFLSLGVYDIAQIGGWSRVGRLFSIIGYGTIVSSLIFHLIRSHPPGSPVPIVIVGFILAAVCLITLAYTVLFEVGRRSCRDKPKGPRRAYRHGSYGVVRHPGFWWYLSLCAALGTAYGTVDVGAFLGLTVVMNYLLILLEDRCLFPRIFVDYDDYRRVVPFLIPRKTPKKRVWPTS
jgi:protein-S-isoprenylcysteine O-methyltransferase Ste14